MEDLGNLDKWIEPLVRTLRSAGIETFESCDGGEGHPYPEPTIRFHGHQHEGWRALAIAQTHGLPVNELKRVWSLIDGEPTGPEWELTFISPQH